MRAPTMSITKVEGSGTGRTRDNLDSHEKVAFSASAMGRLLPAPEALEFSVEYCGVNARNDAPPSTARMRTAIPTYRTQRRVECLPRVER